MTSDKPEPKLIEEISCVENLSPLMAPDLAEGTIGISNLTLLRFTSNDILTDPMT